MPSVAKLTRSPPSTLPSLQAMFSSKTKTVGCLDTSRTPCPVRRAHEGHQRLAYFSRKSRLFPPSVVLDRFADERILSPCQPRLSIPTLLPLPFVCLHNTFKATLRGKSPLKTQNIGWSSDNRRQTRPSLLLSQSQCQDRANVRIPCQTGHILRTSSISVSQK